jgi:hypothetical protein
LKMKRRKRYVIEKEVCLELTFGAIVISVTIIIAIVGFFVL